MVQPMELQDCQRRHSREMVVKSQKCIPKGNIRQKCSVETAYQSTNNSKHGTSELSGMLHATSTQVVLVAIPQTRSRFSGQLKVGSCVGAPVGVNVGVFVGKYVGSLVGANEGALVGASVGEEVGTKDGLRVGMAVGCKLSGPQHSIALPGIDTPFSHSAVMVK